MIRALVLLLLYAIGASAQILTPVTAPTSSNGLPWWSWPAIGLAIVVVSFVWLKIKKPSAAATVAADATAVGSVLSSDIGMLVREMRDFVDVVTTHVGGTTALPPVVHAAEPAAAPPSPAGKHGVAGVFSLTVTGDPKTDLPALTAAYLS